MVAWGDLMKKMIADKDHIIIFEGGAPEDHEPVIMPFITLSETEDAPPWPIIYRKACSWPQSPFTPIALAPRGSDLSI